VKSFLSGVDVLDRRLFDLLTRRERRLLDVSLKRLSNRANRSILWLLIASLLAIAGGPRGRRAAVRGVVAIGITSTMVNLPLKYLARRGRPRRRLGDRPPLLPIPGSFSFPSGHSASAFAFATAVAREDPRLLIGVLPLAGAVAYSRVHLRVHYPFDVLAGAAIGTGIGFASNRLVSAARERSRGRAATPPSQRPASTRVVLVTSPHAGSGDKLARARRAMSKAGLDIVEEFTVDEATRLTDLLLVPTPPLVVVAGGDGTVGAVSNYLIGTNAVMGVLPLGTSNDFARSLDLPMGVEHAARLLRDGKVSTIDAGRLVRESRPPQHFVHAATAGLNVNFARLATRADLRHRLGRLTYAVAGVMALRDRPTFTCDLTVNGDNERVRLEQLSVINTPVIGGALGLKVPGVDPASRTLQILLVEHLPIRRLVRSAINNLVGRRQGIRGVRMVRVTQVTVTPEQPMEVALDGEVCGKIPGTFEVVPDGLRVITRPEFRTEHA
jgi:undecaprenyl-diphosphatase